MELRDRYFIAVYTNSVKDYCDEEFFSALVAASKNNQIHIVDNTVGGEYFCRLDKILDKYPNTILHKISVPEEPKISQFQRNVCESVNYLRYIFLKGECEHFMIVESDVIVPPDTLHKFDLAIDYLDKNRIAFRPWGIIGGIYYEGFHNNIRSNFLHSTKHCLSGCTIYKRDLIEKYPFRYDEQTLGAFPDALISHDSNKEYGLWDNYQIQCEHRHAKNGTRISKAL